MNKFFGLAVLSVSLLISLTGLGTGVQAGDNSKIQRLRDAKKNIFSDPENGHAIAAQIELAKMGQTQELQEIHCQLYATSKEDILDAGEVKIPRVGGWFAIKSLEQMFDANERFGKAKQETNDLSFPAAHQFGLVLLPKLVPNPPFAFDESVILEPAAEQLYKVQVWKQWIAQHAAELSKLQPTGEGVEFSAAACKNGRPRRKSW